MKPLQLIISWEHFHSEILRFIEQAEQLRGEPVKTANELTDFELRIKSFGDPVTAFLNQSFNQPNNTYALEFRQVGHNQFTIPGPGRAIPLDRQIQQAKEKVRQQSEYLSYNLRFLNVCDAIVRPETIKFEERASLTMKQKQELLLDKLFILYDDHYYPYMNCWPQWGYAEKAG